jgi:hypothetical protein
MPMLYRPIVNSCPDLLRVNNMVHRIEKYYFEPVHTMLRLPMPHYRLNANYAFAIAELLVTAIAGASTTLYLDGVGDPGKFQGLVEKLYPWNLEPTNQVVPAEGARLLYKLYRCPLVHDLGVNLDADTHDVTAKVLRVVKDGKGLSWKMIELLERDTRKLSVPTLVQRSADVVTLQVEPFYWGTRILFQKLIQDRTRMERAERFLAGYSKA